MENGKVLKLMIFKLKKIKSDASFREFYRVKKNNKTILDRFEMYSARALREKKGTR